jgi:plasmid segregation protein ParM
MRYEFMRMMRNSNNETIMVIGVDHGYGNMKTANKCFRAGVTRYEQEPMFQDKLLVYNGSYYQIGEEHKEFRAEKTGDEDYYVLTLAAVATELENAGLDHAKVHLAAGLPLTWVSSQKESFREYLLQCDTVEFSFKGKTYHVEFVGADIFPQGFSAVAYRLRDFKGINMLADIGNGTMNIMYINDSKPSEKKCFTEKYGTHQCVLAVRESVLKQTGVVLDDLVIEQVIRTGTADISERFLSVIQEAAENYTADIFRKLREHEYNPEVMRLYVVGGGGCMVENFGSYDKSRVTIVKDICATAKGYEMLAARKIQKNGGRSA